MRTKHWVAVALTCILTAMVVGPLSYEKGRGPPVRIQKVEVLGDAIPGKKLGVRVYGNVRPGCIAMNARGFKRWQPLGEDQMFMQTQILTNVPAVSSLPPVPGNMRGRKVAGFVDVYIPLPNDLMPGDDWYFMGNASGVFCELWWKRIWDISRPQEFSVPTRIILAKAN